MVKLNVTQKCESGLKLDNLQMLNTEGQFFRLNFLLKRT